MDKFPMSVNHFFNIILISILLFPVLTNAVEDPEINPQHPESYVVVSGDTLWEIAGRFLTHPWRWKDLWHINSQIENPHLIYPGDVISIHFFGGHPRAEIARGGSVVKLSPSIRKTALVEPIPTIPLEAIQPFLSRVRITSQEEMARAAYVVGQIDRRLASATGDYIYARRIPPDGTSRYQIYRSGRPYYRMTKNNGNDISILLGIEAIPVGEAKLRRSGDPATLLVTKSSNEILAGDRLFPEESQVLDRNFIPHAPDFLVEGHIIDVVGGLSRVGRLQTVVIDRGQNDGIEMGHVFAIHQAGETISDPITHEAITLPEERAGLLMVFRVFEQLSYALVLEAQREMQLFDVIRTPPP